MVVMDRAEMIDGEVKKIGDRNYKSANNVRVHGDIVSRTEACIQMELGTCGHFQGLIYTTCQFDPN